MSKYSVIIIDDEPKLRKVLEIKLSEYCKDLIVLDTAANIEEAHEKIIHLNPDLIFLDISMPGGSGFDLLARFARIDFEVIFVTGFNNYVVDALKVSAVAYLLKPVLTEDLIEAVGKAKVRIGDRKKIEKYSILQHNLDQLGSQETKIAIPGVNAYDFIKIADIIRCEGWQKYTRIHLNDGSCIVSSYNIGVFKDMLKSYQFFTTHKSHMVNIELIVKYLKEGTVVMNDGSEIPVARRKREEFVDRVINRNLA